MLKKRRDELKPYDLMVGDAAFNSAMQQNLRQIVDLQLIKKIAPLVYEFLDDLNEETTESNEKNGWSCSRKNVDKAMPLLL